MKPKKSSIKKNYLYNVTYQIVALLIPLFITPYLARVLGAESIGIYSYTVSIVTYFMLFGTLGVNLYGAREIAYVQNDAKKRTKVFWEINILRFITVSISLILFCCTFGALHEYRTYFLLLAIYLFSNVFDISWFFQGMENMRAIAIRNTVIRVLAAIASVIFIKSPTDLWIYVLIYSLTFLFCNLSLWTSLTHYLEKTKLHTLDFKRHFKPVLILFIPQIATQIYVVLDKVMIGAIIPDKAELGYYEQGEKIIKMTITAITALAAAMSPRIASAFVKGRKGELKGYMFKAFHFTFMLALPMIAGILVVSRRFVPFFLGPGYDSVVGIMQLLSPIILLIGLSSTTGIQYLIPTKRQKAYTASCILGAATNLIFNAILIPPLGIIGASIGTLLAELVVTGTQLFSIRHEFKLIDILKTSAKYLIASFIMFGICLGLDLLLPDTVLNLLLIGAAGVFIYGASLLLLRDTFALSIVSGVYHKLRRHHR